MLFVGQDTMTLMIDVSQTETGDPLEFSVTVREGDSETHHSVTMAESTYQKLTSGAVPPEQCIEGAFKFLLEREPKESILSRFDVTVISKYFPDFESQLSRYL
ncbi:MAG: hypothetical protein V3T61_04870 [Acidobacteriota bacterium]